MTTSYDERLAARVRAIVGHPGMAERRMFGGLAFLLNGAMCCGIVKRDLVVRVGPERYTEALARPHARPMDFTGRPMRGYVYVAPAGYRNAKALDLWLSWGVAFVAGLPAAHARGRRRARSPPPWVSTWAPA
jgi:hypothetical protein